MTATRRACRHHRAALAAHEPECRHAAELATHAPECRCAAELATTGPQCRRAAGEWGEDRP